MAGFQRLATAVGVAQQGDKALGHQLDADIRRRTDLLLRSPPGAGSIILTLTPATSPIAETGHDGGKVGMFAELSKLKAVARHRNRYGDRCVQRRQRHRTQPAPLGFVQQLTEMGRVLPQPYAICPKRWTAPAATSKSTGSNHRAPSTASWCRQLQPPTSPPLSKRRLR